MGPGVAQPAKVALATTAASTRRCAFSTLPPPQRHFVRGPWLFSLFWPRPSILGKQLWPVHGPEPCYQAFTLGIIRVELFGLERAA